MGGEELSKNFPIIFDEKLNLPLWKDLRELKLRYVLPLSGIKKFFEGLSNGILYGTSCKRCGGRFFPPKPRCPTCGSHDIEWIEVSKNGRLLTYTVVSIKPESYQHHPDYIVGIAEMDDGLRVLAWVKCDERARLRVGMRVKIEIERRDEDDLLLYHIVPET